MTNVCYYRLAIYHLPLFDILISVFVYVSCMALLSRCSRDILNFKTNTCHKSEHLHSFPFDIHKLIVFVNRCLLSSSQKSYTRRLVCLNNTTPLLQQDSFFRIQVKYVLKTSLAIEYVLRVARS